MRQVPERRGASSGMVPGRGGAGSGQAPGRFRKGFMIQFPNLEFVMHASCFTQHETDACFILHASLSMLHASRFMLHFMLHTSYYRIHNSRPTIQAT